MGAISGTTLLRRLSEIQPEIWLDGERLSIPMTDHEAFSGLLRTKSSLYDMQMEVGIQKKMLYVSPLQGNL